MRRAWITCALLLLSTVNTAAIEPTVITILAGESESDSRHLYERELIRLSLEKTKDKFGPYQIVSAPSMSHARGIESMRIDRFPNFIRTFGYDPKLAEDYGFAYVKFPIHRGVTSYRTCFIPAAAVDRVARIRDQAELQQFSYGMGLGWTDSDILRHNGFTNIEEVGNYESLFKMTALGRVDFFCRGTNEVLNEYQQNQHIPGLAHDKSFAIYYPIPLLLYANKVNKPTLDRIEEGLHASIKDGSLVKLWTRYYKDSIDFASLHTRKIFYLKSPLIDKITFDYEQYFFLPPKQENFATHDSPTDATQDLN